VRLIVRTDDSVQGSVAENPSLLKYTVVPRDCSLKKNVNIRYSELGDSGGEEEEKRKEKKGEEGRGETERGTGKEKGLEGVNVAQ
jgi:hypothetical protein